MRRNNKYKKSICFVLPGYSYKAIGGYKIAYEYANRLCEKDYKVCVYYSEFSKYRRYSLYGILARFYCVFRFFAEKIFSKRWFSLDKIIREYITFSYNKSQLLKYDVLVATSLETALELHNLKLDKSNLCLYIIQDFENWPPFTDSDVLESYKFPMKKICITPWLIEKVKSVGENATLIYNGLDFSYFTLTNSVEGRNPLEISLMYHVRPEKRFEDSVAALKIVHEEFPGLHISVFGVFDEPENLPEYFTYHKSPSKKEHNLIYNNSAIYVAASSSEGFGLTVAEAMICGCSVACTDNGGFSSMVKDGRTGLLSPVFDYEALAKNIIRLITDNELRIRLAKSGSENIKKFNWESAVEKFMEIIEQ